MYKSPLHILEAFDATAIDPRDTSQLLRLRKKLLAEFNLSTAATILVGTRHYSKDEIIKLFDELLDNPNIDLHLFVYSQKNLLDFLENEDCQLAPVLVSSIVVPKDLESRIYPFLLESFIHQFKRAFNRRNFGRCRELWDNAPPFTDSELETWYETIGRSIQSLRDYIESYPEVDLRKMYSELDFLALESLAIFLNSLDSEFEHTVNSFVTAVINTLVAYDKTPAFNTDYAYRVSVMLTKVKCEQGLEELIRSNHKYYTQARYPEKQETKSNNNATYIYIAVVLISFIVRGVLFTERHSSARPIVFTSPNNSLEVFDNVNSETTSSSISQFNKYRYYIFNIGSAEYILKEQADILPKDTSLNGKSPFRYILRNSVVKARYDSLAREIAIVNSTGHDLILFSFDSLYAEASLFLNGQQEKFYYRTAQKLCFYFGDSLAINTAGQAFAESARDKSQYDVCFRHITRPAIEIFRADYILNLPTKNKKKHKKSKPIQLILDPDFIETGLWKGKDSLLKQLPGKLRYNF